eukprot:TRINITY_DN68117_c6_g1_i1.p1 TRINITY_DN68117_c6_g1~~TRINITY_DN68117_c6_g1_i1.p1  ORF type:complete len:756 (-),score=48.50 TRINITY_DN68117_c6_g1_i1:59-2326(-)
MQSWARANPQTRYQAYSRTPLVSKEWPRELIITVLPLLVSCLGVVMVVILSSQTTSKAKTVLFEEAVSGVSSRVEGFIREKQAAVDTIVWRLQSNTWHYDIYHSHMREYQKQFVTLFGDQDIFAIYQGVSSRQVFKFHRETAGSLILEHRVWRGDATTERNFTDRVLMVHPDFPSPDFWDSLEQRNGTRSFYDLFAQPWFKDGNETEFIDGKPQLLWYGPELQSYNELREPVMVLVFKVPWQQTNPEVTYSVIKMKFKTQSLHDVLNDWPSVKEKQLDLAIVNKHGDLVGYTNASKQLYSDGEARRFTKIWNLKNEPESPIGKTIWHKVTRESINSTEKLHGSGCHIFSHEIPSSPFHLLVHICDSSILPSIWVYQTAALLIAIVIVLLTIGRSLLSIYFIRRSRSKLLNKVLPTAICERLVRGEVDIHDVHSSATILFADVVGFTASSASIEPSQVYFMLRKLFQAFDKLCVIHRLEKIKTIGDAYMVVGNAPVANETHALDVLGLAVEFIKEAGRQGHQLRAGINTGPIIAGVIGECKVAYDVWGDTVNVAARLETSSQPDTIAVSRSTLDALQEQSSALVQPELVSEDKFQPQEVFLKGKGSATIYLYHVRSSSMSFSTATGVGMVRPSNIGGIPLTDLGRPTTPAQYSGRPLTAPGIPGDSSSTALVQPGEMSMRTNPGGTAHQTPLGGTGVAAPPVLDDSVQVGLPGASGVEDWGDFSGHSLGMGLEGYPASPPSHLLAAMDPPHNLNSM